MSNLAQFAAYAAAFEKAFACDEWSLVAPFFTEDAVYDAALDPPFGRYCEGRAEILRYFKEVLDGFDRHFDSRELALLAGPREKDGTVWLRGSATYKAAGVPPLVLVLEESLHFDGDHIDRMEDRYEPEMKREIAQYLAAYAEQLGIDLG